LVLEYNYWTDEEIQEGGAKFAYTEMIEARGFLKSIVCLKDGGGK
jgi:hypothetical protein